MKEYAMGVTCSAHWRDDAYIFGRKTSREGTAWAT
jgi:hypothetical protein